MPKVIEYGGRQVAPEVTQGARAQNYEVAGIGDFAPAIKSLGEQAAAIKQKIDTTAAEEALNNFEREKNELFFNPEKGYFNSQGRNAYDGAKGATEALNELKKKYSSQLKSSYSQQMFSKAADAHITRGSADIMRHASTQIDAWENATIQSRVENSLETAQLYWNDGDTVKLQNAIGRNSIIEKSKREGITGEALNERLQTYDSSFAKGVITAAMQRSTSDAEQAIDKYGSMLEGPDKLAIDDALAKRKKIEQSQSIAGMAVLSAGNLVNTFGDRPDARSAISEELDKIDDPELRKATREEATRQLNLKRTADSEERAAIFEEAEKLHYSGGSIQQFKANNPEAWDKLDAKQQRALESGGQVQTDFNTLSKLMLMSPRELAKVNPTDYVHLLSPADRNKVMNAVKSARGEMPGGQVGRTQAQQVSSTVSQIFGEKPSKGYKGDKAKQVDAFYSIITDEQAFREEQKGAPLTTDEFTTMLNDMTRKVTKERFLIWDKELDLTDVPAEYLDSLSDYLHQNGIPVTSDNLIKAYQQAIK